MRQLLVLNSGSSSLKFALFQAEREDRMEDFRLHYRGHFSALGAQTELQIEDAHGASLEALPKVSGSLNHQQALGQLIDWLTAQPDVARLSAIGHRVVHGGKDYQAPVRLDAHSLKVLERLIPLAPLHQPHCLAPVELLAQMLPEVPQIACFDTSFHTQQPPVARQFALPQELTDSGILRYGFHGLSYEYISQRLARELGRADTGRVIVAHLGNGASLCALHDGHSVASTMGFTAVEGLPMGTRCGSLDPGVILHLLDNGWDSAQISELLYKRSGLLGVSGISADMRTLLASDAPSAREAIELFVYQIVRAIGSLAAALGGLDHLIFTAGIGERAAPIRAVVCEGCRWLGVSIDDAANHDHALAIAAVQSTVGVWVIPTDEERMIAWHTARLL